MIPRVLEPEVMDTPEEAEDYDAMDHVAVNERFCEDFLAACAGSVPERVLDVGTGTARIPVALTMRSPQTTVRGIDLAPSMLAVGRRNVEAAGLGARIELSIEDAKTLSSDDGSFDAVVSNTILHHIPDPGGALREMWRVLRPSGLLFVRDLTRPGSREEVERLVALHAGQRPSGGEGAISRFERQRALFEASLYAGLTLDEVRALVLPLGIAEPHVRMTSDRHWTLQVRKPKGR